jgi:hypothetical protein
MNDQQDSQTTPPEGRALADEPIPDAAGEAGPEGAGTSGRAREWLAQLEAMIQEIATQAAPVARQVGAKAAELAAIAAVKAGPLAHKAADVTTDVGQRFAERAQSVAAELRGEPGAAATPVEDVPWTEPKADNATKGDATPPA